MSLSEKTHLLSDNFNRNFQFFEHFFLSCDFSLPIYVLRSFGSRLVLCLYIVSMSRTVPMDAKKRCFSIKKKIFSGTENVATSVLSFSVRMATTVLLSPEACRESLASRCKFQRTLGELCRIRLKK